MPDKNMTDLVLQINRILVQEYGHRDWKPHRDPVSELVLTILSQHTSDTNSGRAFDRLIRRYGDWNAVKEAGIDDLVETIRCAGLAQVKAPRIREVLREITSRRGEIDISFLADLSLAEAKSWLRALPGIGPKTAACVLLFSLQRPALPVDTHVHRIACRLGLIDSKRSADRAHEELESMVPPEYVYGFHVNFIEHGRRICKAQRPRCGDCSLATLCPSRQLP